MRSSNNEDTNAPSAISTEAEFQDAALIALESVGDVIWEWNLVTDFIRYSAQWEQLTGHALTAFSDYVQWQSIIHPVDREHAKEQIEAYLAGQTEHYTDEFRVLSQDGSWKWLLSRGKIVARDGQHKPVKMLGTFTDITSLKTIQAELQENSKSLQVLLESSPIAVRIAAKNGQEVIFANRSYSKLINQPQKNTIGSKPGSYYVNFSDYASSVETVLNGGQVTNKLTELNIPNVGTKWVLASYLPLNYDGENCVLGWFYDVTDRLKAQEMIRLQASVFNNAWEGVVISDTNNRIVSVNPAVCEITGYTQEELIGQNPNILSSGQQDKEFYQEMWESLHDTGRWRGEVWNRKKNGEFYAEILTISIIRNDQGEISHYVGIFSDITDLKTTEQVLKNMAHYDALTGLPNRSLLSDRLDQALARAGRNDSILAVCFLDLDGFKPINDQYGHEAGDKLLIEVAERLQHETRSVDTVARLGGDEFVILINDLENIEDLDPFLTRVVKSISENILIYDQIMTVSASIGVAIHSADHEDAETLLHHADMAMYKAKRAGKNRYHIFDTKLDQQLHEHHHQIENIEKALENNEFRLYYQPVVDLASHQTVGLEALIRWQHPSKGLLLPASFLPVISTHDLMIRLGDWVIEQVLHQLDVWQQSDMQLPINVNISAKQIQDEHFINRLEQVLAKYPKVPANLLELEILESTALQTDETVQLAVTSGRQLGVSFSLDNFGAGYSSMTHLRQFPFRTLRIDRSFTQSMINDELDLTIVIKGIVEMARVLKRNVIAEGVETEEQRDKLLAAGCNIVQGFWIARPMPADEVLDWVSNYNNTIEPSVK